MVMQLFIHNKACIKAVQNNSANVAVFTQNNENLPAQKPYKVLSYKTDNFV